MTNRVDFDALEAELKKLKQKGYTLNLKALIADARTIQKEAFPYVKNFGTYIDIGANLGATTNPFVDVFEKVIAFEPNPEIFDLISDRAEKHNVALGNENKTTTLILPNGKEETGHGSVCRFGPNGSWTKKPPLTGREHNEDGSVKTWSGEYSIEDIPVKKLDDYQFESVDFIKIDVEGYEMEVCLGGKDLITKCRPVVWFENKKRPIQGYDNDHVVNWFRNEGFKVIKFRSDTLAYFK